MQIRLQPRLCGFIMLLGLCINGVSSAAAEDMLVLEPKSGEANGKNIVLIAGDEEYRTEESMPMLGKILARHHGFKCTVLFSFGPDGADYIDPNNQQGVRGFETLESADLVIIGTRFRQPSPEQAAYMTAYLNAGKPLIGIRTSTHAFNGKGSFGDSLSYGQFGRVILGEQWVSHHGGHKREGARGVIEEGKKDHPILNGVSDVFAPSDVYGVIHLTDQDSILMRGAVTKTLEPDSENVEGKKNDPMQPLAWLHPYVAPDGEYKGTSFCTTAGASVDFVNEDLRRMVVNAVYHLIGDEVPEKANVEFVDAFYPSFYGFIREKDYWKNHNLKPSDFGYGKTPSLPDPKGSPEWNHRSVKAN